MYEIKNYMLSMQSHWMVNQPLYKAVQESVPLIAEYRTREGVEQEDISRRISGALVSQAVLQDVGRRDQADGARNTLRAQ